MIFSRSSMSFPLVILLYFRLFSCIFQQTCIFFAPWCSGWCYSVGERPGWPCHRPAPGIFRGASRSPLLCLYRSISRQIPKPNALWSSRSSAFSTRIYPGSPRK
nr:MAG TPA: hypothetical protein [Caudoviricetes sp.]